MTSTQAEIDLSYSVSNDFFALWLDENMHYTSGAWDREDMTLEEAQENKARVLYDFAELDSTKTVLDIGCGWGSAVECISRFGIKEAHGITLSTEQYEYCLARNIPNSKFWLQDYALFEPPFKYDGLVSIEMIDHLCSPAQAREGRAVELYRAYFNKLAQWVEPGASFGFQAILRNRVPRGRKDLEDLAFTADVIFPGGLNPRIEELVVAINPHWEIEQLIMRRKDYRNTTNEWWNRLKANEGLIRSKWGDQVYEDYDRYLGTCVRAFDAHWSGDVQMKLRRI
ncbi:MAG: class I SAM-dependent methyltransferase [Alphaproteobacteria bacterium]|nr:class I SAM-dependent methyltransferase [Alphaproteobacteria bacterium]